jgi:predicted transcriptional regulator
MQQRDKYDIVKDILEIVYDTEPLYRNQMNQTRIGYKANLTHPQTVKYLRKLVDRTARFDGYQTLFLLRNH